MELRTKLAAVLCLVTSLPNLAAAQEKKPPEGGGAPAPTTTPPPEEEAPLPDDFKVNDDPSNPDAMTTQPDEPVVEAKVEAKARYTKETYPIEAIKRPLTLTAGQAEVTLEVPFYSFPTTDEMGAEATGRAFTQILRAGYGVTEDLQIGLTYNFGLELVSPESHYEAGKAFSLDGYYTIVPGWLAVQLSLPFYVDPFAMGLTLGLPFRLTITEKIAVIGGADLLQIKISKFPVNAADPVYNVATITAMELAGPSFDEPSANLNLTFGAMWQAQANIALSLMFGVIAPDFDENQEREPMWLDLRWSKNPAFDFGARAGTGALDDFADNVFVTIYTAYRL